MIKKTIFKFKSGSVFPSGEILERNEKIFSFLKKIQDIKFKFQFFTIP